MPARVQIPFPALHSKNKKMAKPTGPTNTVLISLIEDLKKKEGNIWKSVASDLSRPSRKRRIVNLSKISRLSKENETILVPGKVLGSGVLEHKITISAYQFSESAKVKLKESGSKILELNDLAKQSPKGIRIIG